MEAIIKQLVQGLKVQDNSSKMMTFLVQDILDYSQIKSGNFRKNIKGFNIRKAVEKVMSIQRRKAEEMKLDFEAVFVNINRHAVANEKGQDLS